MDTCVNSANCLAARAKGISLPIRNACAIVPGDQLRCSINRRRRSRGKNPLSTFRTAAMGSLHLYLPFSMEYPARAPSIRFRLLPTLRTFHLLVPPISMLQQQLPQHLSHQLPPLLRQLARNLIKTRFRMLFPPIPHRLKHLLRTSHKLRLSLFSFHLIPLFLFSTFLLPQVYLPSPSQKIWDAPYHDSPLPNSFICAMLKT